MDYINTVKENRNGDYLVNNLMNVPKAKGNRHYKDVQAWIALGNIPEPFETVEEQTIREIKEFEDKEWSEYLEAERFDKKDKWIKAGKPKFK